MEEDLLVILKYISTLKDVMLLKLADIVVNGSLKNLDIIIIIKWKKKIKFKKKKKKINHK